ncbi:transmembrane protein 104-like [Plakobranchus ocellatus]|uniref:Transmembrane protein 104-like n=1 Tax=Plakobranchus ocellatus TaxID=259542 RepID=A0AAV4AAB1_9GAST|nr:transmembrane protein 104-like [Plakobranchus ocellatus]
MGPTGDSAGPIQPSDMYSRLVGYVYVFNLIVGTGALTMPAAFGEAGWLLSLIAIIVLAFMSFLTLTFMIETMAISNARLRFERAISQAGQKDNSDHSINSDSEETQPLLHKGVMTGQMDASPSFEITSTMEMGTMASMYFNKVGVVLFNLCIIIYLYGDLSIYAAAVPKSLRDVACTYTPQNFSCNETVGETIPCWSEDSSLTRMDTYRIFVAAFAILLGPFTFFNLQKTKYMQLVTSVTRWLAFVIMIVLACKRLGEGEGRGRPAVANISGVPSLFGVCVYSFMCHHSLPSMVTPIRNKSRLYSVMLADYGTILIFYLILSMTAVFAITNGGIKDLYTLNFEAQGCDPLTSVVPLQYFLVLFPVFTLSTNFPIIAITLRNNLIAMFSMIRSNRSSSMSALTRRILCPLLALLPPIAVALGTNQVEVLVGITGSYAGAGIQYVIPAALVWLARKDFVAIVGGYQHRSPFAHKGWIILTFAWTCIAVAFVTVNHFI